MASRHLSVGEAIEELAYKKGEYPRDAQRG